MIKKILLHLCIGLCLFACESDTYSSATVSQVNPTFIFQHNWNGNNVSNADFNDFIFTTENGTSISIERLRYLISDITFTSNSGEVLNTNLYKLVDVTNNNITYTLANTIPSGNYANVSFTFGLNNENNALNYTDLNSVSFNVPELLGGGYHYMQLDGKFINSNMQEQGFNYHAIRAVDNTGANPTFPQDTFFTVNLGPITIGNSTEIEVNANLAEWFKNPYEWDLNTYNQMLMPNSEAQILMYNNGQSVFSLGDVTQ
ncbi:MbnP family protein [uncultured Winogradskyella sp.]|uniref:MbnP family protein n=1 Tax=uncultured Winogradskyella sp. TaxID=395353 RepID=UPI00262E3204|nr:MbnP family protein [uncultured Winogradskyella sp.]